jgi:chemotaxis protein CheD
MTPGKANTENIVLGIGDWAVSTNRNDVLKTYALGSCVALIMHAPSLSLGALAHVALFNSVIDPEKSRERPGHFADTAVSLLVKEMSKRGPLDFNETKVYLVGGASVFTSGDFFKVGEKNRNMVYQQVLTHGFKHIIEDTGGDISRTVTLSVNDGLVTVSNARLGSWTL